MADFIATTASSGARLTNVKAARKVLKHYYWSGDVKAVIDTKETKGEAHLHVYGYAWPKAYKMPDGIKPEDFEPEYDSGGEFETFLLEMAPHLAEPFTVQAAGAAKCRFPLGACEWHVEPGATEIEVNRFQHS